MTLIRTSLIAILFLFALEARAEDLSAIAWTTNNDESLIGSPEAKRGGILYDFTTSYPLTFRLHGPNSNDMFANWNQVYAGGTFALVLRHPTTDNFIPILATHWSVQPDNKTVYYKLDLDARWSDGKPITADDYIFAATFLRSTIIPLPAENRYMEDYIESVEKVADDVIKVVGKTPSWRPLDDYNFAPLPRHAIRIDAEWPVRENYTPPVVPGPYVITDYKEGERVVFTRLKDWWGDRKRTFTGMFNVDQLMLRVINDPDQSLDYFKKGQLTYVTIFRAKTWMTEEMEFDAIKKGWARRKRVFTDTPQGMSGFFLNVKAPIFQNRDFRKALQYLINFEELNSKLMYNAYYRIVSSFEGTEYENRDLKPYGFNPKLAREHLEKAGYTKRGSDGILVNANGQRASFTLIYGGKGLEPHFNVINNIFKRAGVEMNLQLLEPGASFERGREKAFEAIMISWTAGFYPDPHQYFSCDFADIKQNNNFFGYCNKEVDELINIYRFDMDKEKRLAAMRKIDEIIQDEAIYVPFWEAPYVRFAYWDYVRWPENYLPKRADQLMQFQTFWIDPDRKAEIEKAMKENRSLGEDKAVDVDPYGVKAAMEAAAAAVAGATSAQ